MISEARRTQNREAQARFRSRKKALWNRRQIEYVRTHRARHPEAYRAQTAVNNAVRDGRLVRPLLCERCDQPGKIEAHHQDYTKPLEVEWVCQKCHGKDRHE